MTDDYGTLTVSTEHVEPTEPFEEWKAKVLEMLENETALGLLEKETF